MQGKTKLLIIAGVVTVLLAGAIGAIALHADKPLKGTYAIAVSPDPNVMYITFYDNGTFFTHQQFAEKCEGTYEAIAKDPLTVLGSANLDGYEASAQDRFMVLRCTYLDGTTFTVLYDNKATVYVVSEKSFGVQSYERISKVPTFVNDASDLK